MNSPTRMYDTTNFINDTSDREPTRSELSDKFTNALKASCAAACNRAEQIFYAGVRDAVQAGLYRVS